MRELTQTKKSKVDLPSVDRVLYFLLLSFKKIEIRKQPVNSAKLY